jgi:hypothetical protein
MALLLNQNLQDLLHLNSKPRSSNPSSFTFSPIHFLKNSSTLSTQIPKISNFNSKHHVPQLIFLFPVSVPDFLRTSSLNRLKSFSASMSMRLFKTFIVCLLSGTTRINEGHDCALKCPKIYDPRFGGGREKKTFAFFRFILN